MPECPAQPENRGRSPGPGPGPGPGVNLQKEEANHQEGGLPNVHVLGHRRKQPNGQDPVHHQRRGKNVVVLNLPRRGRGADPGKGGLQRRRG